MPLSKTAEGGLLGSMFGNTTYSIPTFYFSLLTAKTYDTSAAFSVSQYDVYVPSSYNVTSTAIPPPVGQGTNRIFIATQGSTATTSGTEPNWAAVADGGAVSDGGVTWNEVRNDTYWLTGSYLTEVTGGAYARVAYANTSGTGGNFLTPSSSDPASTTNSNPITWPAATADWGQVVAAGIHSAATASGGSSDTTFLGWANLMVKQNTLSGTTLTVSSQTLGVYLY